ncbi:MAG: cupin domain-containing protein, partial [Sphingomicrobium sp.]
GEAQETGMRVATGGLADVRIVRGACDFEPHDGELVFGFVLSGSALLKQGDLKPIGPGDAFVIPPGEAWSIIVPLRGFRLLHVTTARLRQFT